MYKVHHHLHIHTNSELYLKSQDYKQLLQAVSLVERQEV